MSARFARVVEKVAGESPPEHLLTIWDARKLLHREHAAMVRKVKAMMTKRANEYLTDSRSTSASQFKQQMDIARAWAIQDMRNDLLAWLDERGW